jgi:hypothetical protein
VAELDATDVGEQGVLLNVEAERRRPVIRRLSDTGGQWAERAEGGAGGTRNERRMFRVTCYGKVHAISSTLLTDRDN